jgi:hypothetical protein
MTSPAPVLSLFKHGSTWLRADFHILTSFATKLLPYRGLGTGILRALREYPTIDFVDDRDGNLFRVVIRRQARPAAPATAETV